MKLQLVFLFLFFSFLKAFPDSIPGVNISQYRISLKDTGHYSDGFVDKFQSGVLVNIFRSDTGINAGHADNMSFIVQRFSYDNGNTWTIPAKIYDDEYDDRNITGCVLDNDRIVVIFRRYNCSSFTHIDTDVMYSDDYGASWSQRQVLNLTTGIVPFNQKIFRIQGRGYYLSFYDQNYFELRYSSDAIVWDSIVHVWDYRQSQQFRTSESSFEFLGDGNIYALVRNEDTTYTGAFYCTLSNDFGETWTQLQQTNIGDYMWCPSPSMYVDHDTGVLWVVTVDRRGYHNLLFTNLDSRVWVYGTYISEILSIPQTHTLVESRLRPSPSLYISYGYHSIVKMNDGRLYVIGSESAERPVNLQEQAWLYDFIIEYWPVFGGNSADVINHSIIYPNPFTDKFTLELPGEKENKMKLKVKIYNLSGIIVCQKDFEYRQESYEVSFNNYIPDGIYILSVENDDVTKKEIIIKHSDSQY